MAEGEQVQWLDGQANVTGIVEKICPKKHIRQEQWRSEWNKTYQSQWPYDYISDYECIFNHPYNSAAYPEESWGHLQDLKRKGTNVRISNLAHFTTESKAGEIVSSGGFRGGMKKINEDAQRNDIKARFSWWSPKFDENDITKVRDTLGGAISPFLGANDDQHTLQNQFAKSDAFVPNPERYGSSYFQYGISYLCQQYENQVGSEVQFKILGTFGYKKEVMHAVLVCSQADGAGKFGDYPDVLTPEGDANNEAVVTRGNDGKWVWKPQATGAGIRRLDDQDSKPWYRRWEHVAFAFHIPEELKKENMEAQITVDDPKSHLYELRH